MFMTKLPLATQTLVDTDVLLITAVNKIGFCDPYLGATVLV